MKTAGSVAVHGLACVFLAAALPGVSEALHAGIGAAGDALASGAEGIGLDIRLGA